MKFILAVFAACMIAQTVTALPNRKSQATDIVKMVMNIVVDITGNMSDIVEGAVSNYVSNGQQVNQKIIGTIQDVAHNITNEIFMEVDTLFENMMPNASANAKKAITCIQNEKTPIFTAVNSSVEVVGQCVLKNLPELNSALAALLVPLNATRDILANANTKLDTCILGDLCLAQLVANLTPLQNEVVPLVQDGIAVVLQAVQLVPATLECIDSEKADVLKSVVAIFNEGIECIDA